MLFYFKGYVIIDIYDIYTPRRGIPLRWNSTYGLRWPRVPHPFCSPSYFPANLCCFACVSFHIPVLPFPLALPSIPHTSCFVRHFSLLFPPMYFLFPYFLCLFCTPPPNILLSMPAPGPSSSVLSSLSLYPFLSYFPVLWILSVLCL